MEKTQKTRDEPKRDFKIWQFGDFNRCMWFHLRLPFCDIAASKTVFFLMQNVNFFAMFGI